MTLREKIVKLADEVAHEVYSETLKFSSEHRFAIGDQLRRAALSVPTNLIEGFARKSLKERHQFISIAYASLKETKYLLYFASKQKLLGNSFYQRISPKTEELSKLLYIFLHKR